MSGFLKGFVRIAAPILGGFLGGPLGAAAGGALGQTVTGGNRKSILLGGVTGGLGALAGGNVGAAVGGTDTAKALGLGSIISVSGPAVGAGLATLITENKKQQQQIEAKNKTLADVVSLPTFDDIRENAAAKTEDVFRRERLVDMVLPHRLPKSRRGRDITIYNRSKFPPLKEFIKKQMLTAAEG